MALTIEAIDEQTIPILTSEYELEIDISGAPTRAYVDGDMEGFYHEWDSANSKILIKSEKVTRLISKAVWNVHLVKGAQTLDRKIIYNVVPTAPVISNPGNQKLYRGGLFSLNIDIANKPSIARGSGLLSGLKYAARTDGEDGLNIAGRLPADANLTETTFNAAIYAENNGGNDKLSVPITIETHQGVYVFDSTTDDLLKIGPNAATLQWKYEAPDAGTGQGRYDSIVASPDGIYLFSDVNDDLLKVSPDGALLWTFDKPPSGTYNQMVVTPNGIYVHRSTNIYKVHPATGEMIWTSNLEYDDFLIFDDDVYLFNDTTDDLMRLDGETGEVLWTHEAPTGPYAVPAIGGDGVYLLQSSRTLRKIGIADGVQDWQYRTLASTSYRLTADATGVYILVKVGSKNNLYRINASDGSVGWTYVSPIANNPILESDGIYIDEPTSLNRLVKVNKSTGVQIWLYDAPDFTMAPIIRPGGIYFFNSFYNNLMKINKSTGAQDWLVTRNKFRFGKLLVEEGSDIYLIAASGPPYHLVKVNASNGNEQWRYTGTSGYRSLAIPDFQL